MYARKMAHTEMIKQNRYCVFAICLPQGMQFGTILNVVFSIFGDSSCEFAVHFHQKDNKIILIPSPEEEYLEEIKTKGDSVKCFDEKNSDIKHITKDVVKLKNGELYRLPSGSVKSLNTILDKRAVRKINFYDIEDLPSVTSTVCRTVELHNGTPNNVKNVGKQRKNGNGGSVNNEESNEQDTTSDYDDQTVDKIKDRKVEGRRNETPSNRKGPQVEHESPKPEVRGKESLTKIRDGISEVKTNGNTYSDDKDVTQLDVYFQSKKLKKDTVSLEVVSLRKQSNVNIIQDIELLKFKSVVRKGNPKRENGKKKPKKIKKANRSRKKQWESWFRGEKTSLKMQIGKNQPRVNGNHNDPNKEMFSLVKGQNDDAEKNSKELRSLLIQIVPHVVNHYWVYPAKRNKGKSSAGRRRPQNQTSENSAQNVTDSRQPIRQPSDADSDGYGPLRPSREFFLTSSGSIFGQRTSAPLTPTTNLMSSVTSEQNLRTRIEGRAPAASSSNPAQPPKHPQYSEQSARTRSFAENWPTSSRQTPQRMVVFGFFFSGRDDLVRCYQCGIGLKDWSDGDEPLFEHIKHSPNCSFLKQLLGETLLNTYRDNLTSQNTSSNTPGGTATSQSGGVRQGARRIRHPHLSTISSRLATFDTWPTISSQSPNQLAEAGLFFTGINDLCRCFTCDGGLQRWDGEDDPWLEHTRWFPHCQFVINTKGQAYVDMVQAAVARAHLEDEESAVRSGMENVTLEDIDPMRTAAAKKVKEMGYSNAAVMLAVHEFNGKHPNSRDLQFTAEDLIDILMARQERGEPIPQGEAEEPRGAMAAQGDLHSDPLMENQRLKRILKCEDCKERDCNILFLPCTHHRLCEECAEKVDICPNCGRKIEEKLKTFMS